MRRLAASQACAGPCGVRRAQAAAPLLASPGWGAAATHRQRCARRGCRADASLPPAPALQDQTDAFKPAELPDWLFKTVTDALSVYNAA